MGTPGVFEMMGDEYEQVVHGHDRATGLRCIIAVHSTALGPSLGGTRFYPYVDEQDALVDVLRLARGMTDKHAVSGLDLGGGKAVIIGDPSVDRSDALVRAYARQVDRLAGTYRTAEDVGTTEVDMNLIAEQTSFVTGTSPDRGGSGDPSPATAWGLACAIRAAARHRWDSENLRGRAVTVLGVGKVGSELVVHLLEAGALVTVADVSSDAVDVVRGRHPEVGIVAPADALTTPADVLAPCAMGALFDSESVGTVAAGIVCGAANNQLATPEDADRLADHGVLYVPDFVANAGGVINIADELDHERYNRERAFERVAGVAENVTRVLDLAEAESVTTETAARRIVDRRLAEAGPRQETR